MQLSIYWEQYKDSASLQKRLKERVTPVPRRLNTLSKLCLCSGSLANDSLGQNINLHIFFDKLSIETMDSLIKDIYLKKQHPMPMTFVNILGNATAFYLAQHLKINGSCQFGGLSSAVFEEIKLLEASQNSNTSSLYGILFEDELASIWLSFDKTKEGLVPSLPTAPDSLKMDFEGVKAFITEHLTDFLRNL